MSRTAAMTMTESATSMSSPTSSAVHFLLRLVIQLFHALALVPSIMARSKKDLRPITSQMFVLWYVIKTVMYSGVHSKRKMKRWKKSEREMDKCLPIEIRMWMWIYLHLMCGPCRPAWRNSRKFVAAIGFDSIRDRNSTSETFSSRPCIQWFNGDDWRLVNHSNIWIG